MAYHGLGHTIADGDMIEFIKIFSRPKDTERRKLMDGVMDGTSLPADESTTSASITDVGKPGTEYKIAFSMRFKDLEAQKQKAAVKSAAKKAKIASTSTVSPPSTHASSSIQIPPTPPANLSSQQPIFYPPPSIPSYYPPPLAAPV